MEADAHEIVNDAKFEEMTKKKQKLNKYKAKLRELK